MRDAFAYTPCRLARTSPCAKQVYISFSFFLVALRSAATERAFRPDCAAIGPVFSLLFFLDVAVFVFQGTSGGK